MIRNFLGLGPGKLEELRLRGKRESRYCQWRISMQSTFQDKVCIITGGGSGMGRELALLLAERGARVAIVGRTAEKVKTAAAEIKAAGAEALSFALDVGDKKAVDAMAAEVLERWGRADVLVNNAGHSSKGRTLFNTTPEDLHQVLNTNLAGTIYCTQAFLPQMLKQGSGTVMNVASRAGTHPGLLGGLAYSAAKAAVLNFTGYLREEFKNKGVRFTAAISGEVDTPILDNRPVPL